MQFSSMKQVAWFAIFISTVTFAQSPSGPTPSPKGDGITDDTAAIQGALNAAAAGCAVVQLPCTKVNTFKVTSTIHVPKCVKFVGACGAVPFEGSETTIGTTLKWAGNGGLPVVSFHDSPGASLTGISVDCQNVASAIGILYDSDNNPTSSFVNIDNLMLRGCHQSFVVGLPTNVATPPSTCISQPSTPGCTQSDSFKFERYRILGNLSDSTGEGIHINSSNAAQSSLVFNGNIQGVNIGIHEISTNQGLIIENTDTGSPVGSNPAFLVIEPAVADSPTLINDEVEGTTSAVIDHGNNPLGTPGNPVWLNNTWNNHPVLVDGSENITSIGNLLNNATVTNSQAHILSINENGWKTGGTATTSNIGTIGLGGAVFGASLIDLDVIEARGISCPGFPSGASAGDLVACEKNHSGRLYLGTDLMLLNDGDGTLATEGLMKIQTGLDQDGSGLKHKAVSTGNITPGAISKVNLAWTTPFTDANYQAICTVEDNTGSLQVINTTLPSQTQVVAVVKNNDGSNSHTGSLACIAIHN